MNFGYIKQYRKLSMPVKASFWFLIAGFLQKGVSVLTIPLFTRLMSTAEYGEFNIYNSWVGIITIFATLNISAGVFMRGLVKFEEDKDAFTSSMQGLTTTTVLIFVALYFLFQDLWTSIFKFPPTIIMSMFLSILVTNSFRFWSSRQRVDYKYKKLIILTLINVIATPIAGIIAVINTEYKVEARILTSVGIDLLCFGYLYVQQYYRGGKLYDKNYWRYALSFNIPLIPHYLSQVVLNQSDRIMIDHLLGSREAGIYSLAYSLSMVMLIFNTAVLNTLNPWIYKNIKNKNYKRIESVSYSLLIVIAFVNILLVSLAPEIINIMAPRSYHDAKWVIPPIAASVFFIFMYSLFADFEFYYEKTKYIMFASVVGAIMNIILNFIFIPKYGYVAAGYTTLICYVIYAIGHYYFMRKINKKFMNNIKVYSGRKIFLISAGFILICAILMFLYNRVVPRLALLLFFIAIIIYNLKKISNTFKQI